MSVLSLCCEGSERSVHLPEVTQLAGSRCRVGKQIFYLFIRLFFFYYSLSTYYVPGSILGSENKMWSKKSIPL